jgi:hypothetical protein
MAIAPEAASSYLADEEAGETETPIGEIETQTILTERPKLEVVAGTLALTGAWHETTLPKGTGPAKEDLIADQAGTWPPTETKPKAA